MSVAKVLGVAAASISKIGSIETANISKVCGVTFTQPEPAPTYGFITEWTVGAGVSIQLPLYNTASFDCTVDWGDGTPTSSITAYNDGDRTHEYADAGTYQVEIIGKCPAWSFYSVNTSKNLITDIINWGDSDKFDGFQYLYRGFFDCENLKSAGRSGSIGVYGNGVETFANTWEDCDSLVYIHPGLFDSQSNAWNFSCVFRDCPALETTPDNLFEHSAKTAGIRFDSMFRNSHKLTANPNLFGDDNTVFEDKDMVINAMYALTVSFTGAQGTAPDFWNWPTGSGTWTTFDCFLGNSTATLTNYNDIPPAYL